MYIKDLLVYEPTFLEDSLRHLLRHCLRYIVSASAPSPAPNNYTSICVGNCVL